MTNQSNGTPLMLQGRIVWVTGSDLFKGKQKTDYNTKQVVIGPDNQPKVEYGFGLAIPKIGPDGQHSAEYVKAYQALHGEAQSMYSGGQIPPNFAMKYKDGDSVDQNGKPFSDREGYAGHIVIACSTMLPIKFFKFEGNNNVLVNSGIKCGDYVNVQLNIKAHGKINNGNPGLYVNPSAVQFITEGAAIINSPSGDQMFGNAAPVFAGQVVAPTAPTMPMSAAPTAPTMPMSAAPAAPMTPAAPAAPHYEVLPQNMQPPQGNVAQPAAVPQMPGMTAPAMTPSPMGSGPAPTAYPSNPGVPAMPATPGHVANAVPQMPGVYQQ